MLASCTYIYSFSLIRWICAESPNNSYNQVNVPRFAIHTIFERSLFGRPWFLPAACTVPSSTTEKNRARWEIELTTVQQTDPLFAYGLGRSRTCRADLQTEIAPAAAERPQKNLWFWNTRRNSSVLSEHGLWTQRWKYVHRVSFKELLSSVDRS